MHIIVASIDYKSAPVDLREQFAFDEEELPKALHMLRDMKSILECTIISTCNRTEIYAVVDQLHTGRHFTKKFIAQWFDVQQEIFQPVLNIRENDEAIEHLLRVSSGLNRMILGETQILGQVKSSFSLAQKNDATGTVFNQLFRQAVTFSKRAHAETAINDNPASISYAAVELGKQVLGNLSDKHVLILGAGRSELTAKHLEANGAASITVMNRTFERARELANNMSAQARDIEELHECLKEADILISSTSADQYVLTKAGVEDTLSLRSDQPLFMVDIAVPRDLDPELGTMNGVFLYDIDDLEGIVAANMEDRKEAATQIELMIQQEIADFKAWIDTLGVVPVISALREKALTIQQETMESIERKMPELTSRERKVLSKHTKSIVNQLLKEPITRAKEMSGEDDREQSLALFVEIFGLEAELSALKAREQKTFRPSADPVEATVETQHLEGRVLQELLQYRYARDVIV
ncbi:LOW QUALITY PROTEIN: glutamyl-tRNA reductase [Geomicrobium sp. JCM 19037]|nr:LOW QUALITY PROTEIN: glutamyl-tRNA reductase [Geomicrobium sp. JCM 19037]